MQDLRHLLEQAQKWTDTVRALRRPTHRQLHSLFVDGSNMNVKLPELERIHDWDKRVKKWIEAANALIRGWKFRKDCKRTSVSEVEGLLDDAYSLDFSHSDIGKLERELDKVKEWRERVQMQEQDKPSERTCLLYTSPSPRDS